MCGAVDPRYLIGENAAMLETEDFCPDRLGRKRYGCRVRLLVQHELGQRAHKRRRTQPA